MQTQQYPTNALLLLVMFPRNKFLAPYIARPHFWETEMSNSKKSRIIFGLFYFGVFSSLAWPWHNKLMASHFYGASQGLEWLLPIAPVGQYAEAWICSRKIQLFSLLLPTPPSFASPYQSILYTAPWYQVMTHVISASLTLSLTGFYGVGWKAPRWSEVSNTALGSARHARKL